MDAGKRAWRNTALAMVCWPSKVTTGLLMALVKAYRLLLKPWLGNACRFEPTCSDYTLQALQRHGATGGVLLGGWRLLRCQPWCEGGCDPVPDHHPLRGLFTRFTETPPDQHGATATNEPLHTPSPQASRSAARVHAADPSA